MLADNGSAWFISGRPDSRWNNSTLQTLGQVLGSNFEAVDATVLRIDPDSGAAAQNGVTVTVAPAAATVRAGHSQLFTATVTGAPNTVTWSVNGITGGDAIVGTIDGSGLYTAPSIVPNPSTVTVRATSTAAPTAAGSAAVSIIPRTSISSVTPSPVVAGAFTITVAGAGFTSGSVVSFDGVSLATSFVSSTQLSAAGSAPAPKTSVPVVVTTPDGDSSNAFYVNVVSPPPVTISITPASATVRVRSTKQFTATVQNSTNTGVIWKVNGITGGNSTVGTISTSGLYKAPSAVPAPATVVVGATAAADSTKTATASVVVSRK